MKAEERHKLKTNEFADRAAWVADQVQTNSSRVVGVAAAVVAILAIVGGYFYFRGRSSDQASAALGAALAVQQAPIGAALPMNPGATGSYPTAAARSEAAVAAFQKVAAEYTSGNTGAAARYYLGTAYLSLGKGAEADKAFAEAATMGAGTLYGDMAQLGRGQALAVEAKYDEAIKTLTELSARRDTAVPVDGVLMELARICRQAGKTQEARAAFKRVTDEFPQSNYAGTARQQLSTMG
jgi:TolA-binding protein